MLPYTLAPITDVQDRIAKVARRKFGLSHDNAQDFAIHMTDWLYELDTYHQFCADPAGMPDNEVAEILQHFCLHAGRYHVPRAYRAYDNSVEREFWRIGQALDEALEQFSMPGNIKHYTEVEGEFRKIRKRYHRALEKLRELSDKPWTIPSECSVHPSRA